MIVHPVSYVCAMQHLYQERA